MKRIRSCSSINDTFEKVLDKFKNHFSQNLTILRHEFFVIKQNGGERLEDYFTKVINLGRQCELGELEDKLIPSKIISGLDRQYDMLKTKLISEEDTKLTLEYVTTYLKNAEASRLHVQQQNLNKEPEAEVLFVRKPTNNQHSSSKTIKNCRNCGKSHGINKCPAYGKTCYNCNKINHFTTMCMKKKVHMVQEESNHVEEVDDMSDHFFVGVANVESANEITQTFYVNGQPTLMKLDTGAGCNIISTE